MLTNQQFDLFRDSKDVVLTNDVIDALAKGDANEARKRRTALYFAYRDAVNLPQLDVLIQALELKIPDAMSHEECARHRNWLHGEVEPVAFKVMGFKDGNEWMRGLWSKLALAARQLPFNSNFPNDHAAAIFIQLGERQSCIDCVQRIESWRRKPIALSWMIRAKLELEAGIVGSLGMLAELAWMSPQRFEWVAERAMRKMINLLGLERQGRHHELVEGRRELKDFNNGLFKAYMQTR
jgi:hypothetical protein